MPVVIAAAVEYIGASLYAYQIGAVLIANSTLIGYAVTIGASLAYSSSQNAKLRNSLKNSISDQGRNVMTRDPLAIQRKIYGEIPVSGSLPFMHTTGTKNEFMHAILVVASHECQQLGTVYFENQDGLEEVPLDGTGTNGGGNATGKYAGYFFCNKYLGTPNQTADATLIAAAPTKWTANHRLRGHSYIYLRWQYNADLYPLGVPTVRILTKGAKVLDPRVGITTKTCAMTSAVTAITVATAGLSVGMRVIGSGILPGTRIASIDGSGTFFTADVAPFLTNAAADLAFGVDAWSANSALCAADYLADFRFGRCVPWYRINTTSLPAEANICDESVVTDTGSELRYTTNGTCSADTDCMPDLLAAMAGRLIDAGGTWALVAGAYRASSLDFTDGDLAGPFTMTPRQSMRQSYSGVRGTYISLQNSWQPSDFPVVKNDTYTAQDGNVRRWKDVAYPYTISPATAQRLAKIDLEEGRQQIVIQASYKLKAFQVQCCDTIRITRATYGWTNKEFKILKWNLRVTNSGGGVSIFVDIVARETASGIYTWANGEETQVDLAPNSTLPNPFSVPQPTVALLTDSTTVIVEPDGTVQPRLRVTWTTPNNIHVESGGWVEIEYKQNGTATWYPWVRSRGDVLQDFITDVKVGLQYDVRVRFTNNVGVSGAWSATVTSVAMVGDTVTPNTVPSLTVDSMPGFLRLKWAPSTSNAVNEYTVSRATAGAGGPFFFIADTPNSQFDDPTVTPGTTYWYKVIARTRSENADAGLVSAGTIASLPAVGATIPNNPSACTRIAAGADDTYIATDGSAFAFMKFTVPALPTNAVWQNLLYRRNGSPDWMIGWQDKNVGASTVYLDDLTPGVAYDIATQAWSAGGGSAIITATGNPHTAPSRSSAPNIPTGAALVADSNAPKGVIGSDVILFGCRVSWTPTTDKQVRGGYTEVKATFTNADGAVDYTWDDWSGGSRLMRFSSETVGVTIYNQTLTVGHVRIRHVDRTGNASAWVYVGNANGSAIQAAGDMALQGKTNVKTSGVKIGTTSAVSVVQIKARADISQVNILAGGAPTETFSVNLTNMGFSTKPDMGSCECADPAGSLWAVYDYSNGANSATNAVIKVGTFDGTNVPAGAHRFSIALTET